MKRNKNQRGDVLGGFLSTVAFIVVVALLVGLAFLGRSFGWWLRTDNANREAKLIRHGFEVQQDYRDLLVRDVSDLQTVDVQLADPSISPEQKVVILAQKSGMIKLFCLHGSKVVQWSDVDSGVAANYQALCQKVIIP